MKKIKSLDERLWSKVNKETSSECWEWTGSTDTCGYGQIRGEHPSKKLVRPHRYVLEQQGHNLNEMTVLHACDNPKCCNPAHLTIGTQSDNMFDMYKKNRHTTPLNKHWYNNLVNETLAYQSPGPDWQLGRL